jgi:hypothetical protein
MSTIATTTIPASRTTACEPCAPEQAVSALQCMKGCTVTIEGIDDCAIAFLTSLDAVTVEGLVRAWNGAWGFPTASRLAALRDRLNSGRALPAARRAREAA